MTPNADYGMRRDTHGRQVREVWIAWAERQPNPKPSWLVPYDDLAEADKEADRCIGSALWGDGFSDGYEAGLSALQALSPNDEAFIEGLCEGRGEDDT